MAKVLTPESMPAATPAVEIQLAVRDAKRDGPSFDDLESTLAAVENKPRLKIPRKQSNPWPVILLGTGALAVLGLIVMLLILFLPRDPSGGPKIPEIQFVADTRTEVGQTVRIPISVTYPSSYAQADKLRWQLRLGEQNPPGAEWDTASGHLQWSPGTREAGKSHSLSMVIQDAQTRESNLATFQVHVPALNPAIMAMLGFWERQGVPYSVTLPQPDTALDGTPNPATFLELQIDDHLVQVYAYPDVAAAAATYAVLEQSAGELSGNASLTPPLRFMDRDGLIIITQESSVEAVPAIKAWFEATP